MRRFDKTLRTMTVVMATTLVGVAWADIQVPADFATTFTELSTDTSSAAISDNLTILEAKVDLLNMQVRKDRTALEATSATDPTYAALQERIDRYEATVVALEKIIGQLKAGYAIKDYEITTDAATQITTVKITMTDGKGSDVVVTQPIPPGDDGETTGASDGADMLTQVLQQLAMQFMGGGAGGNPLANIQSALNNFVQGTGPVQGMQCAGSDAKAGNGVAVYDISAGKVYMPDGSVLDASSGIGAMMNNPAFANQRMRGPTPPNTYNLSLRQGLFHGVQAIRMTPTDPSAMYGRDGILAHSPLLRAGGSHGCVAFANYDRFLNAFMQGQVKQLVVVPNASETQKEACKAPEVNTPNPQSKAMPSPSS